VTDFVDEWLEQAVREAHGIARQIALGGGFLESPDADSFAREVHRRLSIGAQEYGDSFRTRPLGEIEEEVLQEPPDIAAWAFLYGLRRGLDAHSCQLHLLRASALAAMAQQELRAAIASPAIED
jgi:hypothetical protein